MTFPTPALLKELQHILAYMAHTADRGITFDSNARNTSLVGYSDSDWNVTNSTTGYVHCFAGGALAFGSKRQHCIALSSTEAEIIAASQAAVELVYLRGCLEEYGL